MINVLVRTSNRPEHFRKCINSIRQQEIFYPLDKIRVIVLNDNNDNYAKKEKGIIYVPVNKIPRRQERGIYRHFPYNLYFNEGLKYAKDGRVIFIDDDDYIIKPYYFQRISKAKKAVTICKATLRRLPPFVVPSQDSFGKKVVEFDISILCYSIITDIAKMFEWDEYKVGDYRYIKRIVDYVGYEQVEWIDEIMVGCQTTLHEGENIE